MKFFTGLIYIYTMIYTLYIFIVALRNLKDSLFSIEKKYSQYDEKRNFAVIIYSHNNKESLETLINELKMQDYPLGNFKIYAILDDCNDGSEFMFNNERFVHVFNIHDVGTLGKNKAISLLLNELKKDTAIDSYIFIDAVRMVEHDFLALANSAMKDNDAVTGEVNINRTHLDIIDKIKAVYKKYQANFFKKGRSLLGLATTVDSGLFIVKKSVIDELNEINFKDVNSELEFSFLLSQTGHPCVYNPNIQSFMTGQDFIFRNPKISKRFSLIKENIPKIKKLNVTYIEHIFSMLNPNIWTLAVLYYFLLSCSVHTAMFKYAVISLVLITCAFGLSLVNSKLTKKEICLLLGYPVYSICHIVKNFPLTRLILKKIGANTDKEIDKLIVPVQVETRNGQRPCQLEFISTESGLAKIRFVYKNKKYTTESHLRMIDALQQLKSKMDDYGLILKICSCCANFKTNMDGSKNMLKGICTKDYPSILVSEHQNTLIWNTCSYFEASKINSFIEELAQQVENVKEHE